MTIILNLRTYHYYKIMELNNFLFVFQINLLHSDDGRSSSQDPCDTAILCIPPLEGTTAGPHLFAYMSQVLL